MSSEDTPKGFTVVDSRVSRDDEGDQGPGGDKENKKAADKPGGEGAVKSGETSKPDAAEESLETGASMETDHAPITFPGFLLSLHHSAAICLGLVPDPIQNERITRLDLARENIDLLEMLKEKTKGNLDADEQKLIENILYDLRMAYVQVCKASGKGDCDL